ncbi:MAG TPA: hypothetical protein VFA86_08130 [Gammaproteobacteria bacterium]|nr:hypothetical protein [Gammaproteobacteria bacterium]
MTRVVETARGTPAAGVQAFAFQALGKSAMHVSARRVDATRQKSPGIAPGDAGADRIGNPLATLA